LATTADLAVGDAVEDAELVAELEDADADLLDVADDLADADAVADEEQALEQDEEAGHDVADEGLGAEADGQAEQTRARRGSAKSRRRAPAGPSRSGRSTPT
jgi:hypothetical protein